MLKFPRNLPHVKLLKIGNRELFDPRKYPLIQYRAELQALFAAKSHLIEQGQEKQNIAVLTDSQLALQALLAGPTDKL